MIVNYISLYNRKLQVPGVVRVNGHLLSTFFTRRSKATILGEIT